MKTTALILLLLFTFSLTAQQKILLLTNTKNGKTEMYQENKRIKVKTFDGEKLKGKFKIVDFRTIEIDGSKISLDSIKKIQNKPLALEIIGKTLMGLGGVSIVAAIAINSLGSVVLLAFAPVIALPGVLLDNLNSNHNKKKWDYKIIEHEQVGTNSSEKTEKKL